MKKHVVCFGDSNTFGFCPTPAECADGGRRFNEEERWPQLLQAALGSEVLVIEEGLCGRTTVLPDPTQPGADGISYLLPCLSSHAPVDLLILMLGSNDTKEYFGVEAQDIAGGLEQLIRLALGADCWGQRGPQILLIAPPPAENGVEQGLFAAIMGRGCAEKSRKLVPLCRQLAQRLGISFLSAEGCSLSQVDYMHLSRRGHAQLAERLAEAVPPLLGLDR